MASLPSYQEVDGKKQFAVDKDEKATIIFKCEGVLKDILFYLAKNDTGYGNTITSVITHYLVDGLERDKGYTFDKKLDALISRSVIREGDAIPYAIKSAMENAVRDSNAANYADELAAGLITPAEIQQKVSAANAVIMDLMAKGYNPNDFQPNKKAFGYKWSAGSWIWEVSRKSNEDEEVTINGKVVTRKKAVEGDTHYIQYQDNKIEVICPNIYENALYKEYHERDEYFNRELRKVGLQHQTYKETTNKEYTEYRQLLDECCPEEYKGEAMDIINDKNNECIGAHMVKLGRKNERQYRYICFDVWNKSENTYKQVVFMNDRGYDKSKTAKPFFEVFTKVEQKSRKKTNIKPAVEIAFTDERKKG